MAELVNQSSKSLAPNLEFWNGKSVFISGHTGFKGSWLSCWLNQLGARITGYALPPDATPNLYDAIKLGQKSKSHLKNILNEAELNHALQESQPEIVFHLAAQPLVRLSYSEPINTFATNVLGTAHLLQACRAIPQLKAIVVITTDKVYENQEWDWGYREIDPLGGYDPYSASKACTEIVTKAFNKSFYLPNLQKQACGVATVRAGNVIGGGDWSKDRIIPDIVRAWSSKTELVIRSPHSVRPWQHVLEPLGAYLAMAERLYNRSHRTPDCEATQQSH